MMITKKIKSKNKSNHPLTKNLKIMMDYYKMKEMITRYMNKKRANNKVRFL